MYDHLFKRKASIFQISFLYFIIIGAFCGDNCDFPDTVQCADKSKCIHVSDICNFMPECEDYSDENPDFCQEWPRTNECRLGYIMCSSTESYILNYCITLSEACSKGCSIMPTVDTCKIIERKQLPSNRHEFGCLSDQNKELLKELAESFGKTIDNTTGEACPPLYNNIGNKCVSTFLPTKVTWEEGRLFCNSIGGDLLIIDDVKFFKQLLDHLRDKKIDADFWIGGEYKKGDGWTWGNGEDVPNESPFWALQPNEACSKYTDQDCQLNSILPKISSAGRCIAISFENFYYFSDQPCLSKRNPLCLFESEISEVTGNNGMLVPEN